MIFLFCRKKVLKCSKKGLIIECAFIHIIALKSCQAEQLCFSGRGTWHEAIQRTRSRDKHLVLGENGVLK